jgi:hypothetical protein
MKKNIEEKSNWIFWLTFEWLTPLLYLGIQKPLEIEDLMEIKYFDKAETIMNTKMRKNNQLYKILLSTFIIRFLIAAFLRTIVDICNLSQPILLILYLKFINEIHSSL